MPAAPPPVETILMSSKRLAGDLQRVGRGGADDDRGAVLVVVEDGDVHPLAAEPLDDEAVGGLDVLEVDRAEGRLERADDGGELLGVALVHLDVEAVDVGELLEEDGLALHHRLRRQRADVAEAQDRGAVRVTTATRLPRDGVARRGRRDRP